MRQSFSRSSQIAFEKPLLLTDENIYARNETFHNIPATLEVETHKTFVLVPALLMDSTDAS